MHGIINKKLFIQNRSKLIDKLEPSSTVIIASRPRIIRNGDVHYPYRQSSDLFYLSGIHHHDVLLVMHLDSNRYLDKEVLFIPRATAMQERWEGSVLKMEEARVLSGIEHIEYNEEQDALIKRCLDRSKHVYFGTPRHLQGVFPGNEISQRNRFAGSLNSVKEHDLTGIVNRLRAVKEPEEIEMISQAISITSMAFAEILKMVKPGVMELEIEAEMSRTFRIKRANGHAFPPIIASGRNALVLHYSENSGRCGDGELLLMDFGADRSYYSSDISRTIPVSGKYSPLQRKCYEANLRVLKKSQALMVPGMTIRNLNKEVGKLWEEEHINLGFYTLSEARKARKDEFLWRRYFWHGTSHSMGIDVHDPFEGDLKIEPGMVLTCEPGIYLEEHGFGIRLENDILITDDAPINLSEGIPIEPDEIEALMQG